MAGSEAGATAVDAATLDGDEQIGLAWLAVGLVYLVYLTRGFRKPPPATYSGDEEEVGSAARPPLRS